MRNLWFVVLASCGPLDFNGTYTGTTDFSTTCTDGSRTSTSTYVSNVRWIITDAAGALTITEVGDPCADLKGTVVSINSAEVSAKTCPRRVTDSGTVINALYRTGGTLRLEGSKLSVNLPQFATLENGTTRLSCEGRSTGVLIHEK